MVMTEPADGELERMLDEMESKAKRATKGPWFTDSERSDGTYGVGDETHEGFNTYAVFSETETYYGKPARIFDTSVDVAEVQEEWDEDSHSAWDEQGRRNAEYIIAAQPQAILAIVAAIRARLKEDEARIIKQRTALRAALPHLDNKDSPGGCDGSYDDCAHCQAIRLVRAALLPKEGG